MTLLRVVRAICTISVMETTVTLGTVVRVLSADLQRVVSIGAVEKVRGRAAWVRRTGWVNLSRLAPLSGAVN